MKRFFTVFCIFTCFSLFAQEARFTADSRISVEAYSSEIMSADVFARTALIASGATDGEVASLFEKMEGLSSSLKQEILEREITDEEKKAEFALSFLHENMLDSYSLTQTRIDTALNDGVYNCVSSAVLFMYLVKTLDIQVVAVETPLHAFCTVFTGGQKIDVETTNPYGFNPGVKRDISQGSSRKKYAVVPSKNYSNRRDVDDRRVLSLIYNNRIASLQRQKKNLLTIGLAFDSARLQNNFDQSLVNIRQCVVNAAVEYSSAKKEVEGLSLIEKAVSVLGDNDAFLNYRESAVGTMLNNFTRKDDYESAFSTLETYKNQLSSSCYSQYFNMITVNGLNYTIHQSDFDVAYKAVKDNQTFLSEKDYKNMLAFVYSKQADKIARSGDYLQASDFLDGALQELPKDSGLLKQKHSYRQNYAINVHNQAVKLINSGNIEGAKKLLVEGLTVISESSILKNDLSRID